MTSPRIAVIGGGTMGSALVDQWLAAKQFRAADVVIVERDRARRLRHSRLGVRVADGINNLPLRSTRLVLLAVKPQDAPAVLKGLRGQIGQRTLVVSIMAGVSLRTLQRSLGHDRVIRSMPNLAATVGLGVTAWFASPGCSVGDRRFVRTLFRSVGQEMRVASDDAIDRLTAVSGSGPGYVFATARDLVIAVQSLGFRKSEAERLVKQIIVGAAELYRRTESSSEELFARVASKRGTTEAAFEELCRGRSAALWTKALKAAYRRAREISRSLDRVTRHR